MPIHFICPHCAAATDVDDQYAGQVGPCARCGKEITIPIPEGMTPCCPRISTTMVVLVVVAVLMVIGISGIGSMLVGLLLPGVQTAREDARRATCNDHLKQIAMAMHNYHAVYKCFPPAYIPDKHGRPMHSWRVLLLPYLEQKDLYNRYRFNEPWNSAHNRIVSDLAIGLFQCPSQPASNEPTTNYMMVVGPHTISDGSHSRKIAEITDGPADTIMLVEVADSATWWAEPEDLYFDKLNFTINAGKRSEISSYHPHGANVAFCDGSVRFLKDSTNPQLVKAMLTIDGGENVPSPD